MSEITRKTFAEHDFNTEGQAIKYAGRDRRKPGEPVEVTAVLERTDVVLYGENDRIIDSFSAKAKFWAEPLPQPKKSAKADKPKLTPADHAARKLERFAQYAKEYGWNAEGVEHKEEDGNPVTEITVSKDGQEINLVFVGGYFTAVRSFYVGHDRKFQLRNVSAARKTIENEPEWANKCDERCTMAKSDASECSCECGGENHGKGRLALKAEQEDAKQDAEMERELVSA